MIGIANVINARKNLNYLHRLIKLIKQTFLQGISQRIIALGKLFALF